MLFCSLFLLNLVALYGVVVLSDGSDLDYDDGMKLYHDRLVYAINEFRDAKRVYCIYDLSAGIHPLCSFLISGIAADLDQIRVIGHHHDISIFDMPNRSPWRVGFAPLIRELPGFLKT